jgi:hypothetical protein
VIVCWLFGAGLASAQPPRGWTGASGNPFWSNPANPQHTVTITQHGQLHVDTPITITNFHLTVQTDNTVPAVLCGSDGVVTFTGTLTLAGGRPQAAHSGSG